MKITFTKTEVRDIVISVLVVSFIFWYVFTDRYPLPFWNFLIVVVVSFLFHELAHKIVSQKFGCLAVYKMFPQGLLLGLLFAFLRFIILAPGAVVIYPYKFGRWGFKVARLTITEMGLISIAGISVNLFFAAVFGLFSGDLFVLLSVINAWLAFFNLLPIPPLDGRKVFGWKPWLWGLMFLIAILLILPYFIII